MGISSKYYFEVFVGIILLYFNISVSIFSRLNGKDKLSYLLVTTIVLFAAILFGFAFKNIILKIQKVIGGYYQKIKGNRSIVVKSLPVFIFYAVLVFVFTSTIEFISFSFIERFSYITFGFPIPIYSFVVNRFIIDGFVLDLILYLALTYFLGYLLDRETQ